MKICLTKKGKKWYVEYSYKDQWYIGDGPFRTKFFAWWNMRQIEKWMGKYMA